MTPSLSPDRMDVPFAPACTHRLRFTDDVLGADRAVLAELLEPSGPAPVRVQFWVDRNVAAARPDLIRKLRRFAAADPGRITLAGGVRTVAGGEAVKVTLLKSAAGFDDLCRSAAAVRRRDPAVTGPLIRASVELHLRHITEGGDPFETREARPLDFGHWSAHKLEPMTHFDLRHGEAVAIGVAVDTVYSSLALGLPPRDAQRVLRCLRDLGLPLDHPAPPDVETLFQGLEAFRQHLGGRLTLTMLRGIGDPTDVH